MKTSPYTNTKDLSQPPSFTERWLQRAPYILAIVLTVLAGLALRKWISEMGNQHIVEVPPYGHITELTQTDRFKRAYLRANGGEAMLETLQTIRMTGRIEGTANDHRFTSIKKRPNQMLLSFKFETHSLTYGIDGSSVWQKTHNRQQDAHTRMVEGPAAEALRDMALFFGPVIRRVLLEEDQIEHIEIAEWEGQAALKATLSNQAKGSKMQVYIDPETMHPMARLEHFANGTIRKTIFAHYHSLNGMQEPFLVESYLDNTLQSRVIIESAETNFGAIPSMFQAPKNTEGAQALSLNL